MLGQVSIAAASAVVGYDLASGTTWQNSTHPRQMVAVGLTGSAAALDTLVEVFVGDRRVGEIYNSATGAPARDNMFRMGVDVPAGEDVHLFVRDAPATNPINAAIDFAE